MAHFEADFWTLRQRERTTARSHTKAQLIWMVVLSVLYAPSMVSGMRLPLGSDQDRSRAILPRGLLRALTEGTRWESPIRKKCRNDVVLATMSSAHGTDHRHDGMAMATVRSHVPRSRSRLAPYAVGTSPAVLSGAPPSPRVRARRRTVGVRGWGSIVRTHTLPPVARGRSAGALGDVGTVSKILVP